MQGNHVGLPEQLSQREATRGDSPCGARAGGNQYFQTESSRHCFHRPANIPIADDAQFFSSELDAWKVEQSEYGAFLPCVGTDACAVMTGPGRQLQNKRQRKLRDGMGGITRNVTNPDTELFG